MKNLRISEVVFNELYPDLVGHYDFFNEPPPVGISDAEFESKYLRSKLWRLNNLYTVINKQGDPVRFRMNYAQHVVYARSRQHPRLIILKSRQQGISTFWLVSYFDDSIFAPYLNSGLMAQGKDEAETLLERVKFLWDKLDDSIKVFLSIKVVRDNSQAYTLSNKSNMFIRVSFRSATLQRLHISEFGKIANAFPKRAREVKTGTLQALAPGNTGIIESTAEGNNEFKSMWDQSMIALNSGEMAPKDFYPVFLPWWNDPDCVSTVSQTEPKEASEYFAKLEETIGIKLTKEQKNFWIIQYRELEGDIYQEYPATPEEAFTAAKDGTYWAKLFSAHVISRKKVVSGLYDPNLAVDVYFDIGVSDYMVMIFVQWYRGEWRIIDEYWNNGYDMGHYIQEANRRGYTIRAFKFPHDIEQREVMTGWGERAKKRIDIIREEFKLRKIQSDIVTIQKAPILDGIESVRHMIKHMRIDKKCTYIIDCFLNYSKEWDDKLRVWKKTPLHNEYSHGADTLRQVAVGTIEIDDYHEPDRSTRSTSPKGMAL